MNTVQNKLAVASGVKGSFIKREMLFRLKIALSIIITILVFGSQKIFGQGVGISEVSIVPDVTSILELRSSLRGFLAPRMTTTARLAIVSPAQGLLVYDTDTKSFWYYETGWKSIAAEALGASNQLLGMNAAGTANEYKTLNGTVNQIIVTHGAGSIILSTPQDLHTGASPVFSGLTITSLTPNSGVYTNGTSGLTSLPPSTGIIGYWSRIGTTLTPSNAGDNVSTSGNISATGPGTITSAGIITGFSGLKITGGKIDLNDNSNFVTNINTGSSTGNVSIGGSLNSLYLPKFTTTGVLHNDATGLITSSRVSLTGDVINILPVGNGGTGIADITINNLIYGNGTGPVSLLPPAATTGALLMNTIAGPPAWILLTNLPATAGILPTINGGTGQSTYINGQLLIGNTAGSLTRTTLTGTMNQINVANGNGSITLSTPQNIHTGASPVFVGLTLSGLIPNAGVYTNGTSGLTSTPPTTGTIGYWDRTGTVLSPTTAGDAVTTSGNISTTGIGTITSAGLLTGSAGATISGGTININNNSNFVTNINTGTSSGAIRIGNTANTITLPAFTTPGVIHNNNAGLLSTSLIVNNDIASGTINLTTKVTGVLPIANGGTNWAGPLTNGKVMVSRGGQIVEAGSMNNGQVIVGSTGLEPQIVTMNGDITINNAGATTIGAGRVQNGMLSAGAVTTDEILDLTIVNGDVSATAAIEGTKIVPNFGTQNVVTTGTLASGTTTITGNILVTGTVDGRDVSTDGTNQDALQTLSGVVAGSNDLGTFTGTTISDNSTVKVALQQLETSTETGLSMDLTDAYINGNDLITDAGNGNVIISGTQALEITATGGLIANTADINGGTIDNTVIGGMTPAAATVTNLTATGTVDLGNNAIQANEIEDGAVTSVKILDGEIVNADINAAAGISMSKLAYGTDAQIIVGSATGVPTYVDMSGDVTIDNTGLTTISANAVGTLEIADNSITNAKMADNAIGNAEMLDNAIGNAELQDDAVTTVEIAPNTIVAADIATGAVTTDEILDLTIVNGDVSATAAIEGTKIVPNFGTQNVVTTGTLASGTTTITGNILVTGTVDGRDVSTDGTNQDALQTLSGVVAGSNDLGTFTGTTISDNSTVKVALQQLETSTETGLSMDLTDAYINGNDLITDAGNGNVIISGTQALEITATGGLIANTADINGGTIDNTVIGGMTPAAATVTNLTATGTVDLGNNAIQANEIEDGAVTSVKILDGEIVNADINAAAGISMSKLAYGTDAQIIVGSATGVPTYVDMSGDVTIDNTGLTTISANAVGTLEIADNSITNAKMADNAIGNAEMLDNAIGNAELQDDAVTTVEIAPNTIVAADIATGAVTTDEILDLTIVNGDVSATAAIEGTKIVPNFGTQNVVTTGTLASGTTTITGNILVTGTVDGRDVSTDGTNQDALQTLSGVVAGSNDLGTFTGTTISDNSTVKVALQQLETSTETGLSMDLTDAYINGNDLITDAGNGNVIISGTQALEITATGGLIANTADINGGTIDNTVIGGMTPAAATVTNLTATGTVDLGNNAIQANEIEDGAVTSVKILDGEIVNADINAAAGISMSKLAYGTDAQIIVGSATGVPTYVDMSGDVTIDNTGLTTISANAVGTLEIADNSITNAKMADNAIGNAEMLDNAIGNAELQDDAVTTVEIAPNTIVAADIATGAVTTDEILDLTIVNGDVSATAAIEGTKIVPNFGTQNVVTTGTLASGTTTITGNILVTGTVDGRDVSTDGTNQDALQTLSGVVAGSNDLGTFTGTTISDNSTVKVALQQLETSTETGLSMDLTDAYINGNDLITDAGNGNVIISGTQALEITATGGLIANTADINGGTIDNTVIGGMTPAAATVTNLTATGTVDLGNNAIQANEIEDGAVTSVKILDGEIVNADINAAAGISMSKLAYGTDAQIIVGSATGVPTYVDMSGDVTIDNTGLTTISANAVGTLEIADNSITNAKMADNAIGNAEMLDNAIGNAELQDDAVTTVEIAPNTIVAADIATGAVTTDEILDLTIVNGDVSATAAIEGTKIVPNFGTQNVVTTGTLASGTTTITGNILVTGTVDGRDVSTDGTNQDALQTLSGVVAGSNDLGTFTGTTISDNSTVKVALQQLETSTETGLSMDLTDAYINGNDLITDAGNGNVIISGTQALEITATGGLIANTADINGGTIDNTVIGGMTPAAATVTNLTATGTVDLGNNAIQANEIEDGAVTSVKILDGEIVNADINAAAGISMSKLAYGTDAQIIVGSATGVPTYVDMSGDVTIDNTGLTTISANAVGTLEIADNSITNAKMADNAIGNAEMLDNAIGNAEMADNAVNTNELVDNAVTNAKMADNAINTNELVNNAVTTAKILDANVTNSKLANSTVTIGSTSISLGGSSANLAGLTSVISAGFTGALTGNASTATKLFNTVNINGVAFDGSGNITISASPTAHTLDSHSNVTITSNSAGELLKWNGSAWINNTLSEAGIQTSDADLSSIAGLAGNSGLLRKTAADTWDLDVNTYLTANQSINFVPTGDVTGSASGTTSLTPALTIINKAVTLAKMADMATASLIYRRTAGTGVPEVQSLAALKTDLGLTGTNSGDITLGAIGSTPNGNGASLSGQVLTLQPADGTNGGVVTTGAQTIAGAKTFSALGTFNLGLSASGATINLNAGSNFATNINTGGSTGALTLGNALNTIAVAGIISGANPLVFEGAVANAFETTFAITEPTVDRTITFPDASGTVALINGTWNLVGNAPGGAAILGTTDNSVINIQSGTGAINLGADAFAKTITIGNGIGTTSLVLNAGTGNINIGANAVARTINIGTGAAVAESINIGGTGANVIGIGNTQTAGSIAIGNAMTTGNITIGGTGIQTGTIAIGPGTGAQILNFGTGGTGIKTVNIATDATAANIINIGGDNTTTNIQSSKTTIGVPGTTNGDGVRIGNGRLTINKPLPPITGLVADLSPTVAQILDAGIFGFNSGSSRTLTIPSASGAGGLVQALPGTPAVGDMFTFMVYNNLAGTVTLSAADASVNIVTNIVSLNDRLRIVNCRVTNVTPGSESISVY